MKQFEIRLDAGVTSPRPQPLSRRKSVTFAMAAPETGGRTSISGTAPKKALRFADGPVCFFLLVRCVFFFFGLCLVFDTFHAGGQQ